MLMTFKEIKANNRKRRQIAHVLQNGIKYLNQNASKLSFKQIDLMYWNADRKCAEYIKNVKDLNENPMDLVPFGEADAVANYLACIGRKGDLKKYTNKHVWSMVEHDPTLLFWCSRVIDKRQADKVRFHVVTAVDLRKALQKAVRYFMPKKKHRKYYKKESRY